MSQLFKAKKELESLTEELSRREAYGELARILTVDVGDLERATNRTSANLAHMGLYASSPTTLVVTEDTRFSAEVIYNLEEFRNKVNSLKNNLEQALDNYHSTLTELGFEAVFNPNNTTTINNLANQLNNLRAQMQNLYSSVKDDLNARFFSDSSPFNASIGYTREQEYRDLGFHLAEIQNALYEVGNELRAPSPNPDKIYQLLNNIGNHVNNGIDIYADKWKDLSAKLKLSDVYALDGMASALPKKYNPYIYEPIHNPGREVKDLFIGDIASYLKVDSSISTQNLIQRANMLRNMGVIRDYASGYSAMGGLLDRLEGYRVMYYDSKHSGVNINDILSKIRNMEEDLILGAVDTMREENRSKASRFLNTLEELIDLQRFRYLPGDARQTVDVFSHVYKLRSNAISHNQIPNSLNITTPGTAIERTVRASSLGTLASIIARYNDGVVDSLKYVEVDIVQNNKKVPAEIPALLYRANHGYTVKDVDRDINDYINKVSDKVGEILSGLGHQPQQLSQAIENDLVEEIGYEGIHLLSDVSSSYRFKDPMEVSKDKDNMWVSVRGVVIEIDRDSGKVDIKKLSDYINNARSGGATSIADDWLRVVGTGRAGDEWRVYARSSVVGESLVNGYSVRETKDKVYVIVAMPTNQSIRYADPSKAGELSSVEGLKAVVFGQDPSIQDMPEEKIIRVRRYIEASEFVKSNASILGVWLSGVNVERYVMHEISRKNASIFHRAPPLPQGVDSPPVNMDAATAIIQEAQRIMEMEKIPFDMAIAKALSNEEVVSRMYSDAYYAMKLNHLVAVMGRTELLEAIRNEAIMVRRLTQAHRTWGDVEEAFKNTVTHVVPAIGITSGVLGMHMAAALLTYVEHLIPLAGVGTAIASAGLRIIPPERAFAISSALIKAGLGFTPQGKVSRYVDKQLEARNS